ncbi:MAG: hypothetical protein K5637_05185 [Lachnospiraceae bacterium]|nr:hypothetical protein [Lachnospiraceae bacterium]
MELQIQDLVSSIRKEGIDAANSEANAILAEAKNKADALVADAKAEAKRTLESAEKEIGILKESAIVSSDQAKRDALLAFKSAVQSEYENILSGKINSSLDGEALGKLISAAVKGEDVSGYTAEVAEVSDSLKSALAEEIKGGLTIKPTKGVQAGFRLAANDGSGYFDCTDDEIMQMLMPYFRNLAF